MATPPFCGHRLPAPSSLPPFVCISLHVQVPSVAVAVASCGSRSQRTRCKYKVCVDESFGRHGICRSHMPAARLTPTGLTPMSESSILRHLALIGCGLDCR